MDPVDTFHVGFTVRYKRARLSYQSFYHSIAMMLFIAIPFLMKETRSAVVLTRIAKKMRKKMGNTRYRARVEDERASLKTLIWISCTRPLCECEMVTFPCRFA